MACQEGRGVVSIRLRPLCRTGVSLESRVWGGVVAWGWFGCLWSALVSGCSWWSVFVGGEVDGCLVWRCGECLFQVGGVCVVRGAGGEVLERVSGVAVVRRVLPGRARPGGCRCGEGCQTEVGGTSGGAGSCG